MLVSLNQHIEIGHMECDAAAQWKFMHFALYVLRYCELENAINNELH